MAGPVKKKQKAVVTSFKLQLPAGKATPAPPVGPALSQHGLNIMEFVNQFNKATAKMEDGMIVPAEIQVHPDKTFTMNLKTPPASYLLRKAAGILKGSSEPNKNKVGKVTRKQVEEIARLKMTDLNTKKIESAMRIVEGSARSMGLEIKNV
ncbi:MAG TPA: 50S ribosomal protein L11 [Candidatus Deferrimicrobium sp.]|nr:50S ribosomal protein L11 [Candidatus Kapabacteria bacterium]HLP58284.1 50S ribosomal protein L11 [Candidatus Deferrimicrobium sp.]